VLTGAAPPRELAAWAHSKIGHDQIPIAERLVDSTTSTTPWSTGTKPLDEIDADVIDEARRIVEGAQPTTAPDNVDRT
jgi:hypothetical protein